MCRLLIGIAIDRDRFHQLTVTLLQAVDRLAKPDEVEHVILARRLRSVEVLGGHGDQPPPALALRQEHTLHDDAEPAGDVGAGLPEMELVIGAQQGVLQQVLRIRAVAGEGSRIAPKLAQDRGDNCGELGAVRCTILIRHETFPSGLGAARHLG
jgi:hypothetical protein